jgi:hypothetical protein
MQARDVLVTTEKAVLPNGEIVPGAIWLGAIGDGGKLASIGDPQLGQE